MSTKFLTIGLCCLIASLGFAQSATAADSIFPAPTILNGPAEGSTINTESTQFVFDYLEPITGGSLTGFLCSLDGAPAVACTSPLDLVGLGVGVHTIGVAAVITPLGGEPLCVLTVCVALPTVALNSEELVRTFNVETAGPPIATTTNNTNNNSMTTGDKLGAFALAWGKYKRQQTKCNAMKKRVKKYKTHKNRMRAAKRYKECVKTQKRLRAQATAIAR
jgi:hypothetical protein